MLMLMLMLILMLILNDVVVAVVDDVGVDDDV